jgi:hypothetical protein
MKKYIGIAILFVLHLQFTVRLYAQAETVNPLFPYWITKGNTGTDEALHFIGTTNDTSLFFRTNNIRAGWLDHLSGNIFWQQRSGISNAGTYNTGIGYNTLFSNISGNYLLAIGDSAMYTSLAANGYNLGIGHAVGKFSTTATHNVWLGAWAGAGNGSSNVVLGNFSLASLSAGNRNVVAGNNAAPRTKGIGNVILGTNLMTADTSVSDYNIIIGHTTVNLTTSAGDYNIIVGKGLARRLTGSHNIYFSSYPIFPSNTISGNANIAFGEQALANITTGENNVGIGFGAGAAIDTASGNVAISSLSLYTMTDNNVAIGGAALGRNTEGKYNVAVGSGTLQYSRGDNNTAIGRNFSSVDISTYAPLFGGYNTAFGSLSGADDMDSSYNTYAGFVLFSDNIVYGENTAMGTPGFPYNGSGHSRCTFLGAECASSSANITNSSLLGYNSNCAASNQVRVGDNTVTSIGGFANWTNISDGRFKDNITGNVKGLEFVKKLRPVTYNLAIKDINSFLGNVSNDSIGTNKLAIAEKEAVLYSGFIAQEVELAAKESNFNFSGIDIPDNECNLYGLRYEEFVVPLVKAVQEQQVQIEALQKKIALLKAGKEAQTPQPR